MSLPPSLASTGAPRQLAQPLVSLRGEKLQHSLAPVDALRDAAAAERLTVAEAAIAWVASRGDDIVPLIGGRRRDRLATTLAALQHQWAPETLARIEPALPAEAVAGTRHNAHNMALLDSERT